MMIKSPSYGLALLFTINTINFLDRLSIAAVLTQIKDFYALSGFEAGLLSTCFLGGYMLTAPVFGYLGDRYSRKWILIGGISFWSMAAFSASLMGQGHSMAFFISRILVGVGEASYSTVAPTIIADLFEPSKRKLALSIFYFAIPVGSGLGFLMGTLAIGLGDFKWIFRVTPAIGLLATMFLLPFQEPIRGQSEGTQMSDDNSTVMANVQYLFQIRSYVWATIAFTLCLFTQGALSWWAIQFMVVACGNEYESMATSIFGCIVFIAGLVGVTIGSTAAQYFRQRDGRADPLVCAVGIFAAVPLLFFGLMFARSATGISWLFMFLAVTALSTNWAVVSDMVLAVTLPNKRAFATAFQIFASHALGDATSPFIVGFVRDQLETAFGDQFQGFLYALLISLIALVISAIAFLHSAKFYVQDVDTCKLSLNKSQPNPNDDGGLTDFATLP